MKNEAEYCTCIVKSMNASGLGYKIPDPSGDFAFTVKRCFDIIGRLDINGESYPVYCEAKFSKDAGAFSLKRIEDHQAEYLSEFAKIANAKCYIAFGCSYKRGDVRSFIFDWKDLKPLFERGFSIHKKYLDKLPYNKISNGAFKFENIISAKELCEAYSVESLDLIP